MEASEQFLDVEATSLLEHEAVAEIGRCAALKPGRRQWAADPGSAIASRRAISAASAIGLRVGAPVHVGASAGNGDDAKGSDSQTVGQAQPAPANPSGLLRALWRSVPSGGAMIT